MSEPARIIKIGTVEDGVVSGWEFDAAGGAVTLEPDSLMGWSITDLERLAVETGEARA